MSKLLNKIKKLSKNKTITKLKISTAKDDNIKSNYKSKWKFYIKKADCFYNKDGYFIKEIEHIKKYTKEQFEKYANCLFTKYVLEYKIDKGDIEFLESESYLNKKIN